ncbi:hypothetical protein PITC_003050 [Penicillium italicum]|uniref:Uncharacterized protein n=1 Tax=Penicillium italicum TaxID=40296 RepID=A0A0A2KZI3_PENIT|nr:hypothetical protein PITC_003050 [Penicillium italicum]
MRDSAGQEKEIYASWSLSVLGHPGSRDTAVFLCKECRLTLAHLDPLSRYAALGLHDRCIRAINNWMIRAYQRC